MRFVRMVMVTRQVTGRGPMKETTTLRNTVASRWSQIAIWCTLDSISARQPLLPLQASELGARGRFPSSSTCSGFLVLPAKIANTILCTLYFELGT